MIQFLAAVFALWLGLYLPDIDLAPLLLRHRSAWTHGPFWALALPLIPLPWWAAWMPAAFLLGITIHLARDCFPKAWAGAALINAQPLNIRLPAWLSFIYLAGSAMYSGWHALGYLMEIL